MEQLEEIKLYVGIFEPIIKLLALFIGGIWAYNKYIRQREREPATEIDMDVRFVGKQQDQWIIEVTAFLENKGLVRHQYEDFQLSVRYIEKDDEIKDGNEKVNYQLYFPKTIDERIGDKSRTFHNADFINPRLKFRHRYITSIPIDSTFIWVQGKFFFKIGNRRLKTNSQKIFSVPEQSEDQLKLETKLNN